MALDTRNNKTYEDEVAEALDTKPTISFTSNPGTKRCAYIDTDGTLTYSSTVTSTEIGRLDGLSENLNKSRYHGKPASGQDMGENQVKYFNWSSDFAAGVSEEDPAANTDGGGKVYKVKKAGYYLIGCIIAIDNLTVGTDSASAYIRAVVSFNDSNSSSGWDAVQGYRLYFYASSDQVEVTTYRYLPADSYVRFGMQHGGSGDFQTGTVDIKTTDESRAFIAPTL